MTAQVLEFTAEASTQSAQMTRDAPSPTPESQASMALSVDILETRVTDNAQWSPIEQVINGVPMVLVPAGCTTIGSSPEAVQSAYNLCVNTASAAACNGIPFDRESPATQVCFDQPFWLDKHEVSTDLFASDDHFSESSTAKVNVTWEEANRHCLARSGRLPSEAEWEYAARGPSELVFPWGNSFDGANLTYKDNFQQPNIVTANLSGASWVGALNLSGNVWEWTNTEFGSYPYQADSREDNTGGLRVIRGGGWTDGASIVRPAYRGQMLYNDSDGATGFRCASDFDMSQLETDTNTELSQPSATTEIVTPVPTSAPDSTSAIFDGIQKNDDWRPYSQQFNGIEMMLVPVGCFQMGRADGDVDETPVHQQCIERPFWIDKTEVTNLAYGSYGWWTLPEQPREVINYQETTDYCRERGARLPTEVEWAYAARGPDSLLYPWGNVFMETGATYGVNSGSQTNFVGTYPDGASWVGAVDMVGNVWEWTSSAYAPYPYNPNVAEAGTNADYFVLRGGSYINGERNITATDRQRIEADFRQNTTGFRCVLDFGLSQLDTEAFDQQLTETRTEPTAIPLPQARIVAGVNLRSGPGTSHGVVGSARQNQTLVVYARAEQDGAVWYQVGDLDGQLKWVSGDFVVLENVSDADLPLVQSP